MKHTPITADTAASVNAAEVVREKSTAETGSETPTRQDGSLWNAAIIDGDLSASDAQDVLNSPLTILKAAHHRMPGDKWEKATGTVEQVLDGMLTHHPVDEEKHGFSVVYADAALTGKATTYNGVRTEFAFRRKDQICATTAISIDVDGTDQVERLRERIRELGWFAVVYTTHSHAAKKVECGDRFRTILFLDAPFDIPEGRGPERSAAIDKWEAFYVGVCNELGLLQIDASGMRLNQIQHPPRRPSDEVEYLHFVIAGGFVSVGAISPGDPSLHKKSVPKYLSKKASRMDGGTNPCLSDGFDVREWFYEGGCYIQLEAVMADLGLEDLGSAGPGWRIICSNEAQHTETSDESYREGWACDDFGDEGWAIITCHHDHCSGMRTWDFIAQWEGLIDDGVAVLPDRFESLSAMLCADDYLPDDVNGEELDLHPSYFGVVEKIEIPWLGSKPQVSKAFKVVQANEHAGVDHYAALYAGVIKAGSKPNAIAKLAELMKDSPFNGANKLKEIEKRGKDLYALEVASYAAEQKGERRREAEEAIKSGTPANTSLDIADPLGETVEEALATLAHRYVLSDVERKFRVVRKPDLDALRDGSGVLRSVIVAQTSEDFVNFHSNRSVVVGSGEAAELVNPAKEFLLTQDRMSGLVFAPFPAKTGHNKFNMYYGRTLEPALGDARRLRNFIFRVVCGGRREVYKWLMLWMAHMVQFPGEKPGTSVVVWGQGGCGKSTFGLLLEMLTAPHCRTLSKSDHITGRFAGEHLSTCILAVCTESAFAGDPKTVKEMKALITQTDILVEPKGLPCFALPSFVRIYIDTNSLHAVQIEGNGSERRYFVLQISDRFKGREKHGAYWDGIYEAIAGDPMAALLQELMDYRPEDHGFTWNDVRTAPSTVERDGMRYKSLRPVERALVQSFLDGAFTFPTPEGDKTLDLSKLEKGCDHIRLPCIGTRSFIDRIADRRNAAETDFVTLMEGMFGKTISTVQVDDSGIELVTIWKAARERRGKVDGENNVRFFEVPPLSVLLPEIAERFDLSLSSTSETETLSTSAVMEIV